MEDQIRPPWASQINTRSKLFSQRVIAWFWPFAREEPHGHPPFYALLALIGDVLTPGRDELSRARLGAMLLFAATSGGLFASLARRRGVWSGVLGAGAFALSPQLFAMGHYAHYDAPLTCLWLGSVLAFAEAAIPVPAAGTADRRSPRWGWVVFFGVLAGAAAGTKLTGWLLPLPFLFWTVLYRERTGALTLAVGGLVAAATVYAVTPPWWPAPWEGLTEFFVSNLTRGETTPIAVQFLGTVYLTPNQSLPWYNTLVWTVAASPVGFLAWALVGSVRAARDRRRQIRVARGDFLALSPGPPRPAAHAGSRWGPPDPPGLRTCWRLWRASASGSRPGPWSQVLDRGRHLGRGGLDCGHDAGPPSYFSPAVGGLPGAARLGFEPTYYWDTLTPGVLDWVNRHTAPGRSITFMGTPFSYYYLKQSGQLRPAAFPFNTFPSVAVVSDAEPPGGDGFRWTALIARHGHRRRLLTKLGVPLVWAFDRGEVEATAAEIGSSTIDALPVDSP